MRILKFFGEFHKFAILLLFLHIHIIHSVRNRPGSDNNDLTSAIQLMLLQTGTNILEVHLQLADLQKRVDFLEDSLGNSPSRDYGGNQEQIKVCSNLSSPVDRQTEINTICHCNCNYNESKNTNVNNNKEDSKYISDSIEEYKTALQLFQQQVQQQLQKVPLYRVSYGYVGQSNNVLGGTMDFEGEKINDGTMKIKFKPPFSSRPIMLCNADNFLKISCNVHECDEFGGLCIQLFDSSGKREKSSFSFIAIGN